MIKKELMKKVKPYLKTIKVYADHFLKQIENNDEENFLEDYFKEKIDTLDWDIEQIKLITKQLKKEDCRMITTDFFEEINKRYKKSIDYYQSLDEEDKESFIDDARKTIAWMKLNNFKSLHNIENFLKLTTQIEDEEELNSSKSSNSL